MRADIKAGGKDAAKGSKVREWSNLEISVKCGSAEFVVNGEKAATQKLMGENGPLVLRAEFGGIAYKNIRATEAK